MSLAAFGLTSANNTLPSHVAMGLGHHRSLALGTIGCMEIQDNPVSCFSELMRACRVGVEGREVPFINGLVHDGKPRISLRIEAPWRNAVQRAGERLPPILGINGEEEVNIRFSRTSGMVRV